MEMHKRAPDILTWEDTEPLIPKIKQQGLQQFAHNFKRMRGLGDFPFKWGDEVEQMIVRVDDKAETVRLVLNGTEVLEKLRNLNEAVDEEHRADWRPENGEFMAESSPHRPYGGALDDLVKVEASMRRRRDQINGVLGENEKMVTMTTYPLLGCKNFTVPALKIGPEDENPVTRSIFFHDDACCTYPAYKILHHNMMLRKKSKFACNIPIYRDENTPLPFREKFHRKEDRDASMDDHIYMDSDWMAMSSCCLQTTVQLANLRECKKVYDQLVAVSPVLLALSASSPFFRGHVSDVDTRWTMMAQCNDDRRREEMGRVSSSRWDSAEMYLSEDHLGLNDVECSFDRDAFDFLLSQGVDEALAKHVAHIWVRDPLILSNKQVEPNVEESYCNFEAMNNYVWQPVRLKPPPRPGSPMGWRCELRVVEVQPTDFENAAFAAFVVLLVRSFAKFDVDLTTPLSGHRLNMDRAQARDAVGRQKFSFPNKLRVGRGGKGEVAPMSVDEIVNGDGRNFIGLIGLAREYVKSESCAEETWRKIDAYLNHLSDVASGETLTVAQKMRRFVEDHEDYKGDSKLSHKINYDMMKALWKV